MNRVLESLHQLSTRQEVNPFEQLFINKTPVIDYKVVDNTTVLSLIVDVEHNYPAQEIVTLTELLEYCEPYEITSVIVENTGEEIVRMSYNMQDFSIVLHI